MKKVKKPKLILRQVKPAFMYIIEYLQTILRGEKRYKKLDNIKKRFILLQPPLSFLL